MNYHATARTNYFAVRDEAAFRAFIAEFPDITILTDTAGTRCQAVDHRPLAVPASTPVFALLFGEDGIPSVVYHADTETEEAIDFAGALAEHLAPGWVAELREVGAEGHRFLVGYAVAINSAGERRVLDLDTLARTAAPLGPHYSETAY
jgi:hypothetical protein